MQDQPTQSTAATVEPTQAPAANGATTQQQAATADQTTQEYRTQADVDRVVEERLKRERNKWEQEKAEIEKRAKLDEAERLKLELQDRDNMIAELAAKATQAQRLAELTGKVADPKAALKLLEDAHLTAEGGVNVEAFLTAYPFLKTQDATPPAARGGSGNPPPKTAPKSLAEAISDHYKQ